VVEGEQNLIDRLVDDFAGKTEEKKYNSAFFYNLRKRFALLFEGEGNRSCDFEITDLLTAEYLRNRDHQDLDRAEAKKRMERLSKLCKRYRRVSTESSAEPEIKECGYSIDGLLLIRFLAERGQSNGT
jgi:2,3-bisphosphoglycerate-independent phosphoglycerate mutase